MNLLREAFKLLLGSKEGILLPQVEEHVTCIGNVRGQERAKLGLLYSAIGGHNVLLIGPPGEGKSFIISTMKGFMPPLKKGERYDLENIYQDSNLRTPISRPLIEVSPNVTSTMLLGGGHIPTPGAISLSHAGILFMDELPEYDRKLLEALRGPMESGDITITRKGETKVYDCRFQLIAAMNPCPCGYYPDRCKCGANKVSRYQSKLSGPLLDRIDMIITMDVLPAKDKFKPAIKDQTKLFRLQVLKTLNFQVEQRNQVCRNAHIPGYETFDVNSKWLMYDTKTIKVFQDILDSLCFSSRKAVRLAKLSRTIADINMEERILPEHVKQGVKYLTNSLLE